MVIRQILGDTYREIEVRSCNNSFDERTLGFYRF
jgi:hypothetical protein